MKLRRAFFLSAFVFTLGAFALPACGDEITQIIQQGVDGGEDGGRRPPGQIIFEDAGEDPAPAVACVPQTPPARTFVPTPRFQNRCTAANIDTLVKACLIQGASEAACNTATDATPDDCFDCLFNVAGARPNAALVQFDAREAYLPSLGTCVTAVSNESAPNSCAVAVGELDTCTKLACVTPCRDKTVQERIACEVEARDSVCLSTASRRVFSDECQKKLDDGTYGGCFDEQITQEAYLRLIMNSACGPNPNGNDAGIRDSGADADADTGTGG